MFVVLFLGGGGGRGEGIGELATLGFACTTVQLRRRPSGMRTNYKVYK